MFKLVIEFCVLSQKCIYIEKKNNDLVERHGTDHTM